MRAIVGILLVFGTVSAALAQSADPDVRQYGVGKTHTYTQTGPTTVTPTSYTFEAFIDATANGTVNQALVQGPLSGYFDTHGPQSLSVYDSGAEFRVTGYLDQNALDLAFPNDSSGNYKLYVDTGALGGSISHGGAQYDYAVSFDLGGDAYVPDIPTLTANNGAWQGGTYVVAATGEATSFGWTFTDFDAATDVVLFSIRPANGGDDVLNLQFQGSNPGGYTLAANLLTPGVDYTGQLSFARIVDNPADIPGASGVAYYAVQTTFEIQAVPEPSTYALFAAGLGIVGIAAWRRRRRSL